MDPQYMMETNAIIASLRMAEVDSNMIAGLNKHLEHVRTIAEEYEEKVARINASPDFTAEGKRNQIRELAESASERLEKVRAAASGYDDHIAQLQESLTPKPREGSEVLQFLQEREIRDRLYANEMDSIELQLAYQEAAGEGGNDLLMYAVENAPKTFPLLPQEVLDEGRQKRTERQSPETASKLRELLSVRKALDNAIASARAGLGLAEDDTLTRVAAGEV